MVDLESAPVSRIYFPLKSSVELFNDRETPEAVTRVKQAAILYDEVVIEDGLFTAAIPEHGGNSWWKPWSWVDEESCSTRGGRASRAALSRSGSNYNRDLANRRKCRCGCSAKAG